MGTYRNIPITLGPVTLYAALSSAFDKSDSGLKMVCPDHESFVHQELKCDEDDHLVNRFETRRGAVTEDGMRILASVPKHEATEKLVMTPVPAAELESHTVPGDSIYYVKVKEKSGGQDQWLVFDELVRDKKTAYIVKAALRKGRESLFRLTIFNGYLALQQIRFPESVREHPEVPTTATPKKIIKEYVSLAKQLGNATAVAWDEFNSTDEFEQKMNEAIAAGELVDVPASAVTNTPKASKSMSAVDMMDALRVAVNDA